MFLSKTKRILPTPLLDNHQRYGKHLVVVLFYFISLFCLTSVKAQSIG